MPLSGLRYKRKTIMAYSKLQIFGEEHRQLAERIVAFLHGASAVDLTDGELLVQIVTCDGLEGRGGCHPRDFVLDMRAERVEYIDEGAFALHVSRPVSDGHGSRKDAHRRIVVRCEDIWVPPFVSCEGLRGIAERLCKE